MPIAHGGGPVAAPPDPRRCGRVGLLGGDLRGGRARHRPWRRGHGRPRPRPARPSEPPARRADGPARRPHHRRWPASTCARPRCSTPRCRCARTFTLKELVRGAEAAGPRASDEPLGAWLEPDRGRREPGSLRRRRLPRRPRRRGSDRTRPGRLRGHRRTARPPLAARRGAGVPGRRSPPGAERMRVAIGADHAGFDLKAHLVLELKRGGHEPIDLGTHGTELGRLPTDLRRRRARGGGRRCRPGHRAGRIGSGRADRRQQGARRARGALQRPVHRALRAASTTTPTCSPWAGASSPSVWPSEILELWLATPFEGGRHERRVAQIADIENEE